jgi:hypothetical protein
MTNPPEKHTPSQAPENTGKETKITEMYRQT